MCRLLGFAAPTPTSVLDVLGDEQTARFQQMARLHDDGWGSVQVDTSGDLHRTRSADSGHDDERLSSDLRGSSTVAEVVHLRLATDHMEIDETNTHPFLRGGMAMAHNGSIVPTDAMRDMLGEHGAAELEGDTDSELYFALVRREADRGATPVQALARTAVRLRQAYPVASLNAMLLTNSALCVVRSSQESVPPWEDFVASGLADDELPLNHRDAYFRMHYRHSDDGTCLFSSVGLEFDGWHELPDDHIAWVDLPTLQLTVAPLEEAAGD